MTKIHIITLLSLRETLRDRILWGYSFFALLLVLGLFSVAKVPWGEVHFMEAQLGYSAIALVSQVFVAVVAALQFGRDAERRVHYMILGRDIRRSTYVIGKFLGLWITASLLGTILVFLLLALVTSNASYRPPMWSLLGAVPVIALQAAMVLSIAMLLYQVTTSMTLAMLLSLLSVAIGRSIASVQLILSGFGDLAKLVGSSGAYLFPNLELIAFNEVIVYEKSAPLRELLLAGGYSVAYTVAALSLAVFVFNRKEL